MTDTLEVANAGADTEPTAADVEGALSYVDYYNIDALLTEEERAIRDKVRRFCDREVIPVIDDYWDRAEFPFELFKKFATLGIAGGSIKGYGCPGYSEVASMLVAIELARGDGSLNTAFGVHSGLAMGSIAILGSEEQKQKWLPPMARMELIGAFGLTEPTHGSDAVAIETSARREGDAYVINGARDEDDGKVKGFLVEKGAPGYSAEVLTGKITKRAVWQAQIALDNVRVPATNKLEQANSFKDTGRVLTATRF